MKSSKKGPKADNFVGVFGCIAFVLLPLHQGHLLFSGQGGAACAQILIFLPGQNENVPLYVFGAQALDAAGNRGMSISFSECPQE